jgi:hypothetical protein
MKKDFCVFGKSSQKGRLSQSSVSRRIKGISRRACRSKGTSGRESPVEASLFCAIVPKYSLNSSNVRFELDASWYEKNSPFSENARS